MRGKNTDNTTLTTTQLIKVNDEQKHRERCIFRKCCEGLRRRAKGVED